MKEAIFTLGLPGAGKTTVLEKILKNRKYTLVSADAIREQHIDYDQRHPEKIHEYCVQQAEKYMYFYAERKKDLNDDLIVMDGGGINNSYTPRIINRMREYGYKITIIYINTPPHICVNRNIERQKEGKRFVPIEAVLDKSYLLRDCITKLKNLADEFIEIKHFKNDVIFVDMDGTVAEYYKLVKDLNNNIDFVNYNVFKYSKPVLEVIDKLKNLHLKGKKICILSASPNSLCNIDKIEWIKKYMPFIKEEDIYFCGNKEYKHVMLQQLMQKMNLKSNQVMAIDDDHNVLERYDPLEINAVHPSSFLTNY